MNDGLDRIELDGGRGCARGWLSWALLTLLAATVLRATPAEAMEAACGWCDASRAKAEDYLARVEASLGVFEAQWATNRAALGTVAQRRMDELLAMLADQRDALRVMLADEGDAWAAVIEARAGELAEAVEAAGDELRALVAGGGQQAGAALGRLATGTRSSVRRVLAEGGRRLGALDPIDGRLMASVEAAERSVWSRGIAIGVAAAGLLLIGVGVPTLRRARWLLGVPLAIAGLTAIGAGVWLYRPRGEPAAVVGIDICAAVSQARAAGRAPPQAERRRLRAALAQCRVRAADPVLAELALTLGRELVE